MTAVPDPADAPKIKMIMHCKSTKPSETRGNASATTTDEDCSAMASTKPASSETAGPDAENWTNSWTQKSPRTLATEALIKLIPNSKRPRPNKA